MAFIAIILSEKAGYGKVPSSTNSACRTQAEFEKTKLKIELEKLRINRSIAIECRYSLILRLQDNKSAEELLRYLNKVHNEISVDEDIKEKEFNDHINNLIVITYNFCRDYVDNSNMNKTQ